jgi:hypothetical protein
MIMVAAFAVGERVPAAVGALLLDEKVDTLVNAGFDFLDERFLLGVRSPGDEEKERERYDARHADSPRLFPRSIVP